VHEYLCIAMQHLFLGTVLFQALVPSTQAAISSKTLAMMMSINIGREGTVRSIDLCPQHPSLLHDCGALNLNMSNAQQSSAAPPHLSLK
jgi:hypothetical protein